MKRKVIKTADGSTTIFLENLNEHYHSKHGAIQEAYHVFIKNGLDSFIEKEPTNKLISILEIGFGTGLNALITYIEHGKKNIDIHYEGVDAYPVNEDEITKLNYVELLNNVDDINSIFKKMHLEEWNKKVQLTNSFSLFKRKQFIESIDDNQCFDIIYFDAFGARVQPELWTVTIFNKMFKALKNRGVLVTYAAKGSVKRALIEVGFDVEKLPGPPGKREMLRGVKNL